MTSHTSGRSQLGEVCENLHRSLTVQLAGSYFVSTCPHTVGKQEKFFVVLNLSLYCNVPISTTRIIIQLLKAYFYTNRNKSDSYIPSLGDLKIYTRLWFPLFPPAQVIHQPKLRRCGEVCQLLLPVQRCPRVPLKIPAGQKKYITNIKLIKNI